MRRRSDWYSTRDRARTGVQRRLLPLLEEQAHGAIQNTRPPTTLKVKVVDPGGVSAPTTAVTRLLR